MVDHTHTADTLYRKQVARYVVPRVVVIILAGFVVWVWGQSRPYPIDDLAWATHLFTAIGALVYGGVALYIADLADDGEVEDPHVRARYALIAPATLTHELMHATAARLLGGEVHELENDGGVFTIAVDVPADRPRWARAAVDVAPTLLGIPLVIAMGLFTLQTVAGNEPLFYQLMATVAFIYCQVFAIPSGADLRSAWATLTGARDRAQADAGVQPP